jgi:hypothetical protein
MHSRLFILPETPRYLIKMDRYEEAAKSLGRLRRLPVDHPAIVEELNEVQSNHVYEMSLGKSSYLECFKGTLGKRLLTGCLLQSLQQLTGVNFIFYYGTQYFINAGFKNPFITQVITNSVNVVSTLPGLYMVEKLGRRNLLLLGAIGMCVCQCRSHFSSIYSEKFADSNFQISSLSQVLSQAPPISRLRAPPLPLCASTSSSSLAPGVLLRGLSPANCTRSRRVLSVSP